MKRSSSLVAACLLALATSGPALAADISAPTQPLDLFGNAAGLFSDSFATNNIGNTFADRFTFTVGAYPFTFDALVASISTSASTGLDITGFGLYSDLNGLVFSGTPSIGGAIDLWEASSGLLDPGSYYLEVGGTVVSDRAASYFGAVLLTPVPEPTMLGMLAGGLGLLGLAGWGARRRGAFTSSFPTSLAVPEGAVTSAAS